jgi:predicted porin
MNKKLIALAVAGACAAPVAMAQTANPVTLYGRVYLTLEQVEVKDGGISSRSRIEDQSSLLGVRGTEDLGGGLKAFFQLETAFKPDSAPGTFANRNSGIGLQGGWGSVLIGRWDMPFKLATIAIDPYGDLTNSGITGVLSDLGNFDRRAGNVFQYWTPNWGGFAARLAVTTNEGKNDATGASPRDWGASVTYTRGPLYVFGAYEKHDDQVGSTVTANAEEKAWALGGRFDIGPLRVGAQYQQIEKNGRSDTDNLMANLIYTMGKNQLIYQFMRSEGGAVSGSDPECDSHSLGWQYNFTRRTFFIASYVRVENDNGAICSFGANKPTVAGGQDPRSLWAGLRHVF